MFLSHLYINIIAVTFGCSLFSFKLHYPKHLQLISVLLGLTWLAEFAAVDGMLAIHAHNNMLVYNPFMLVEFCVFAIYFKWCSQFIWLKKLINLYLVVFTLLWLVCVFVLFGINKWNSYISVVGSAFTIFFAAVYYYQLLTSNDIVLLKNTPEFWIATGVIIFYAGNLPYTGMLNFLDENYKELASHLTFVLKVLNIIMYSLFTYAFLCRTSITNSK